MDSTHIYLIASSVTRFGAILLLIFGVQILVQLYKYNVRLSAFYEAQADAIDLVGVSDIEKLTKVIQTISPNNIDFGKNPRTPTHELAELAKHLKNIGNVAG